MVERATKEIAQKRSHEKVPIPSSKEMAAALRKQGIAEVIKTKEGIFDVVDTDALREYFFERFGNGGGRDEENTTELLRGLSSMFPKGIISREQFYQGERTPDPLFYNPGPSDAVSTAKIKAARFHFRFKDVLGRFRVRNKIPDEGGNVSGVTYLEADAALVIFHPRYGNGYRDEDGVLRVMDDSGVYKPISADFLTRMGVHKNIFVFPEGAMRHSHRDAASRRSIRDGIAAELPHLVARGLMRPEDDFRQITLGNERINSRHFEKSRVSPSGSTMINGVSHYIGRNFADREISISRVSPSLGVVVDESGNVPRVTHVFRILTRDEANSSLHAGGKRWFSAPIGLTKTHEFNAESFGIPKLPTETKLAYEERKEAVDRGIAFLLLQASAKFPALAEMFSGSNQKLLGDASRIAYWLGKEDGQQAFDRFYESYGNEGLRSLLATTVDQDALKEVMSLARWGEKHDIEQVSQVFEKFSELTDRIDSLDEHIRSEFGEADPELAREVTEKILVRARGIIGAAYAAAQKGDLDSVLADIESIDTDTKLLVDISAALSRKGKLDPRKMQGSEAITISGGDFKGMFRGLADSMMSMQDARYGAQGTKYSETNPEFFAALQAGLRDRIESGARSRFHILMYKGEVAGFFRFDEKRDDDGKVVGLHLGSVIANPVYEGSRIISTFLEKELTGIKVPIYAECDPERSTTPMYLGMGFVVGGVGKTGDGKVYFNIERDPALHREKRADINAALLRERAEHRAKEGKGVEYTHYSSPEEMQSRLSQGFVVTHWMKEEDEDLFYARLVKRERLTGASR